MEFRSKALSILTGMGIEPTQIEQRGEDRSIVFHIPKKDNLKITTSLDALEKKFGVVIALSDLGGFNVVIIEDEDVDSE